jgi:hypothetical protein
MNSLNVYLFFAMWTKIEVVHGLTPPFKSPYLLNFKKLQKFKTQLNNLMK